MGTRRVLIAVAPFVCALAGGLGCGLDAMGLAGVGGGGDDAGFDASLPPADDAGDARVVTGDSEVSDAAAPDDAAQTDGSDGSAPPPPPSDAGCPGVVCNGQCTNATDCHACAGATLLCRDTHACLGDCASCAGLPIACYACDANRQNPIGTCEAQNGTTYCLDTDYAGVYVDGGPGYHCGCATASDCPGDDQVCIAVSNGPFACFTCGEAYTQGASCKSGLSCNPAQDACRP